MCVCVCRFVCRTFEQAHPAQIVRACGAAVDASAAADDAAVIATERPPPRPCADAQKPPAVEQVSVAPERVICVHVCVCVCMPVMYMREPLLHMKSRVLRELVHNLCAPSGG